MLGLVSMSRVGVAAWLAILLITAPEQAARAASAVEIDTQVGIALDRLLRESETAQAVADRAVAVLVFPNVVKGGFGVGGQFGEGALLQDGVTTGYYNIAGASIGLQIGAQTFAQAMFFMTEEALAFLDKSAGFEIGADANVAFATEGLGYDVTTSTIQDPIIAFLFGQQGLMGGLTLEGSKITKTTK